MNLLTKMWLTLVGLGITGSLLAGPTHAQRAGDLQGAQGGGRYDMPPGDATAGQRRSTQPQEIPRPGIPIGDEELERIKALPGSPISSSDPVHEQKTRKKP